MHKNMHFQFGSFLSSWQNSPRSLTCHLSTPITFPYRSHILHKTMRLKDTWFKTNDSSPSYIQVFWGPKVSHPWPNRLAPMTWWYTSEILSVSPGYMTKMATAGEGSSAMIPPNHTWLSCSAHDLWPMTYDMTPKTGLCLQMLGPCSS